MLLKADVSTLRDENEPLLGEKGISPNFELRHSLCHEKFLPLCANFRMYSTKDI